MEIVVIFDRNYTWRFYISMSWIWSFYLRSAPSIPKVNLFFSAQQFIWILNDANSH